MDDPGPSLLAEDNLNDVELAQAALNEGTRGYRYRRGVYAPWPEANPKVLLDHKLPKVDGLERREVEPVVGAKPAIRLTSSREEANLLKNHDLGTNACVVKPVSYSRFTKGTKIFGRFWVVPTQLQHTLDQSR